MRLTKRALEKVNTPVGRRRLMEVLGDVAESTVYRYIAANNDILTKAAVLKVIKEVTGLTDDEILEEGEPVAAGK